MAERNGEYDQDLEDRILKIVTKLRSKSVRPCYQNIHCKLNQGGREISMDDTKVFIDNLVEAGLLLNKPRKDKESFYLNNGGENNSVFDESVINSDINISNQSINSLENFINEQFYTTIINRIKSEVNIAVKTEIKHSKLNELIVISDDEVNKTKELEEKNKLIENNKTLNAEIKLLRTELLHKDEIINNLRNVNNITLKPFDESGKIINDVVNKKADVNNNYRSSEVNNLDGNTNVYNINKSQTETSREESNYANDKDEINYTEVKSKQSKKTKRQITILGTSIVKNIQAHKMKPCMKANERIYIKSFSGATVRDLVDYSVPSRRYSPDLYILHGGGNDLPTIKSAEVIADELINLASDLKTNENDVIVSSITKRNDRYNEKGMDVNHFLQLKCNELSIGYIDNSNIGINHLNNSGLHLNYFGTKALANNFLKAINI